MPQYTMRIEAVNFDYSIYDTHDISTIRGGSSLILNALKGIEGDGRLAGIPAMKVISAEASEAIIRFTAADTGRAAELHDRILSVIPPETRQFATFVSALLPEAPDDSFQTRLEKLKACCRRQQFTNVSFVPPKINKKAQTACSLDGVRPEFHTEGEKKLSETVFVRRKKGRKLRHDLYTKILGKDAFSSEPGADDDVSTFVNDLETLSSCSAMGNLDGKIAFIHLDGNRFGKIREMVCTDEDRLERFQNHIQKHIRNSALKAILSFAEKNASFQTKDGDIRLETLLWGGDEIEWIVPAWQGINVLKLFFKAASNRHYSDLEESGAAPLLLTHAGGVVFCRHSLPILQIRKYARRLCEFAKTFLPKNATSLTCHADCFAFLNMSSFDIVKGDIISFLEDYHYPVNAQEYIIRAAELESLEANLTVLKRSFPKNRLFDIVRSLRDEKLDRISEIVKRAISLAAPGDRAAINKAVSDITRGNLHRWYVIADLIHYIGEDIL